MTDNVPEPGLSPSAKRALLARLLAERASRREADGWPLSSAQERLWFFDQLVPGSAAYNLHTGIRLTGPLEADALERAIQEIVGRHDALRTAFPSVGGSPVQVVAPQASIGLARVDLTAEPDPEAAARRLGEQDAARPFDLGRGPLIRVTLLELAASDHLLLVAMHHIVSDGWSLGVFVRELSALYDAFVRGAASPLPPLRLQFPEFARAQRQALTGTRLQEQLTYWRGRLSGAPSALELGTDHPRPPTQSFRGGTVGALLSKELVERLRTMARAEGATLFMALLAAFEILLWRRSGQEDFVVGTPVSGRAGSDTEPMIGCFINTLVLRADLAGNPGVRDVLARVREAALGGFEHADVPFERLVEELQPDRDLARNPLYQVMFNLVTLGHAPPARPDGLALQVVHLTDEPAKLDLSLYAIEEAAGLRLRLVYARDLFDAATAEELLSQYEELLGRMAHDLDAPAADIPLVTPSARRVLPDAAEALPERSIEPVTATFVARAQERPDHPALLEGTSACTYGVLSARVEAIAHGLVARGVTPGDAIAITGAPDADLLAGVLGIMRARGVLLLLDPRLPVERRRLMVTEAGARHLLIAGGVPDAPGLAASLGVGSWSTVAACADSGPGRLSPAALEHPRPEDAAYVFFTSGTTGVPKAVVGVHKGLAHFVEWQRETFGVGPADRVAQLTGLSFDVVLREIFLPLTSGATLCLRPPEAVDDLGADRVLPWLEQQRITTIHTVPTLAQSWLAAVPPGLSLAELRRVFFAGEPLSGTLVRRWRAAFPATSFVVNLYGPTETTLAKCFHRVPDEAEDGVQPVGRPLPETQALVLTPGLTLCGIGECGEIAIRTPYRTRGYRNAPEEQQKRFVRNPWRDDPADLIYLTGDRGRYQRDGTLEILGRVDDQVKIRGVRIELGEVTATLLQHPGVRQAAAIVRKDEAGHARLVAYVVAGDAGPVPAGELRAFLERRLPDAMVPSAIVPLSALPLTANGKLDRRALPEPAIETIEATRGVLPRTPVEEEIAEIWQELLGRPVRSVHETFFDAGGHSLQATQLVSRLRTAFHVDLSLRAVYERPTVAGLAGSILGHLHGGTAPADDPIDRLAASVLAPASIGQRRLWVLEQVAPASPLYVVSAAARLIGPFDVDALEQAFGDVVARHESLRTTVEMIDGAVVQRLHEPAFRLDRLDLREIPADRREDQALRAAAAFAGRGFSLSEGPLVRAAVVSITDTDTLFVVAMHHAVSDVWSLGVLFTELSAGYAARLEGRPAALAPLRVQYRDFAAWEKQRLDRGALDAALGYWRTQLGGELPLLDLPTDRPRPAVLGHRGSRLAFGWPADLTARLKQLSRSSGVTLFTTLAAAYALVLSRYARQDDLLIGFPIAGRARTELEPLIGFFVNTLVLRADLSGDPTTRELLSRVRATTLDAYAHQDVPFDRLVEQLRLERRTDRHPLFQVGLALHNAPFTVPPLPGLEARPVDLPLDRARFDLHVSMWEAGGTLAGTVEYSTELFDATTAEDLHRHLRRALEGMAAAPDRPVSTLSLLDPAQRAQVVSEWNATTTAYPRDRAVHEIVERQAAAAPAAVAVSAPEGRLTYAELNDRANRLARFLRRRGVTADTLIAVCLERTLRLPVALLAILKAGGAYVPLDPHYPSARLAYMLADSRARLVLTDRSLAGSLPDHGGVVCLDDLDGELASLPSHDLDAVSGPDNLAYVTYTSGSTGTPKGAAIPHRAILRLLVGVDYVRLGPGRRLLHLSPISFDASTFEIWGALALGGCCALFPGRLPTGPEFAGVLARERVTTLWLTAALFNALVDEDPAVLRGVEQVLTGGEALSVPHVRRALDALPGTEIINGYGPTESTTFACCHRVPRDLPADASSVPIGRPIGNTRAYVLDLRMEPVPPHVPGELYIGGDGLARGYVNHPALTAERFVPDPFAATPGGRLYRTGDIVRWRVDGTLEFIGRMDDQVKIRGFRIEPGEVEAVLRAHAAVREAVVVVREDTPGDKRLVAYVRLDASAPATDLRAHLKDRVPAYMVPSAVVLLEEMPLSANGKVDRQRLPAPPREGAGLAGFEAPRGDVERRIAAIWSEVLDGARVGVSDNFFDIGGHSLLLVRVHRRLCDELGCALSVLDLFRYPTVATLAEHLVSTAAPQAAPQAPRSARATDDAIAIVGMAGRFPGAAGVAEFWANLKGGVESITFFSDEQLVGAGIDPALVTRPDYVKARGAVDGEDLFDAGFFGYNPREAALIDPQQRVFLECAWEALEDAGCDPTRTEAAIGVYAGVGMNTYAGRLLSHPELAEAMAGIQFAVSSDKDFLPTRVSYKLNLRGPSVNVQTACSTSLVAVHLACRGLVDGDCDMALAGGVRITVPQTSGYLHQAGSILSPDGHCRAFDEAAAGTVSGSGAAVVVLKRLADAQSDGNAIYAVIKGSAINNDGSLKVGYTAPSVAGQAAVIARAHARAGVEPATIGYVEAHGTATHLGDPVEIAALTLAFGDADRPGPCAIGSLKTNVGHLDAAAGAAGLMKVALMLRDGVLPPSLHFRNPNPGIDFAHAPFVVNTSLGEWRPTGGPRRAGVSSFGLGGTNAHAVLEEPPAAPAPPASDAPQVIVLSARSDAALASAAARLAGHLEANPQLSLADVAFTLQVGRRRFDRRWTAVCDGLAGAVAALRAFQPLRAPSPAEGRVVPAFLFTGQGAQRVDMGRALYDHEPVFRRHLDECAATLTAPLGFDLRTVLYPGSDRPASEISIDQTAVAQPALFAVEYALAQLWMSWGIGPGAMIGHSVGEIVAACLAGVMSLDDALGLVAARGRAMQRMPPGAMLAVPLGEQAVVELLGPGTALSIAAVNSAASCVVSGEVEEVSAIERSLADRGIEGRRLATSHAFHSPMMDGALDEFRAHVRGVLLSPPAVPFVSNVTGTWITAEQATDPEYWVRHLRGTVRFHDGVETLLRDPGRVLLEVGPGRTLTSLARPAARAAGVEAVASLDPKAPAQDDRVIVRDALGRLWRAGVDVNWRGVHEGEPRVRVSGLPTYPFERQRYWIEPATAGNRTRDGGLARRPLDDWFYRPSWTTALDLPQPAPETVQDGTWLVCEDEAGVGTALTEALRTRGAHVVRAIPGTSPGPAGGDAWRLRVSERGDYDAMLEALQLAGQRPRHIVYLWALGQAADTRERAYYGQLFLLQSFVARFGDAPARMTTVTADLHDVHGTETAPPDTALALWPARVMPLEWPSVSCAAVDLDLASLGQPGVAAESLLREATSEPQARVVAVRNGRRSVQAFSPLALADGDAPSPVRTRGVYLVTGGTGGVGLELARHLATAAQARLVLVGRSAVPARDDWSPWLAAHDRDDAMSRVIRQVMALESLGSEVMLLQADVASEREMRLAVDRTLAHFGALHGVLHAAGADKTARAMGEWDRALSDAQFRPRLDALPVLERVLDGIPLDFCVVQSSLAAVLGAAGYAPYTASHLYADAFASAQARRGAPWRAIDWDNWTTWKNATDVRDDRALRLSPAEATAAFARILAHPTARHVVVSTASLDARTGKSLPPAAARREAATSIETHARPAIATTYVAPRTDAERVLAGIWQQLLGLDRVGVHDNFFELGGDSVIGIQVVAKAASAGLRLSTRQAFEHQTIAELAAVAGSAPTGESAPAVSGPVPLTPIQHWFFEQRVADPDHFNQAALLEVQWNPGRDGLVRAARALGARHDALRVRYEPGASDWQQVACDEDFVDVSFVDLSAVAPDEQDDEVHRINGEVQRTLSLARGPLMRIVWIDCGPRRHARLLVVAHHLIVDAISWRILLDDLRVACEQAAAGQVVQLPPVPTTLQAWARGLAGYAASARALEEQPYWTDQPWHRARPLPLDGVLGVNTVGSTVRLSTALTAEETTALVQVAPDRLGARVHEILLTALYMSVRGWSGHPVVLVDLEGHGREDVVAGADLSRTVGWFTTIFPLLLEATPDADAAGALEVVRRQVRSVPNGGIGYGVLRYLAPDPVVRARFAGARQPELSFLYLGRADQEAQSGWMRPTAEQVRAMRSPRGRRRHAIEVAASIAGGCLQVTWTYSEALHTAATIGGIAETLLSALRRLIAQGPADGVPALTPADFPAARVAQDDLDRLLSAIRTGGSS